MLSFVLHKREREISAIEWSEKAREKEWEREKSAIEWSERKREKEREGEREWVREQKDQLVCVLS
jgi:hypothetical protein